LFSNEKKELYLRKLKFKRKEILSNYNIIYIILKYRLEHLLNNIRKIYEKKFFFMAFIEFSKAEIFLIEYIERKPFTILFILS